MKFFKKIALTAVAALGLASTPAFAATINLSGVNAVNTNVSADTVDQTAVALNANLGSVVDSVVGVSGTVASNVANTEVNTKQIATGAISGNASVVSSLDMNLQLASVTQGALAGNLSGNLQNSTLNVDATAASNIVSKAVITVQK